MTLLTSPAERERLEALDSYDLLDTPAELDLDRIVRIASNVFDVPTAAVGLIDAHRQWMKARCGPVDEQTGRDKSFCNVTIENSVPLIVENAANDLRFKDHPSVVGPPHIRFYAGVPLRTPEGQNIGALCAFDQSPRPVTSKQVEILKDLGEMVMSAFEARKLSRTDSLTGVLTRRGFREEAERALALSVRHSHPLSCIALDLDHFKAINDVHGHALGDRILVEAVNVCRERLRSSDIFGRIGGEEFAIVLPHTSEDGAMKLAGQIRAALEQRVIVVPSGTLKATASFGIAMRGREEIDLDELLRRADTALYAAKDAGRNACVTWKSPKTLTPGGMRRVLKAGQIVFNAGRSTIDCTVRGLGDNAARLDVGSTAGIPDTFKLSIADDKISRLCTIVLKQNLTVEVAFAGAAKTAA
jgi:diguanylate cyclase (GGDEF)-like protein